MEGFEEAEIQRPADFAMERVGENTVLLDFNQARIVAAIGESWHSFVPAIRSGDWSDIGGREYMEDAHVCIPNLAKNFGYNTVDGEIISFYGVFDGHGGKDAALYVRDNLPRVIVEDAAFPLELETVVRRSFVQTDTQFAERCSIHDGLSSGTTALTAMIFGRSLLVANAGDCRAVLSRRGTAIEMSKDHRTCCLNEENASSH